MENLEETSGIITFPANEDSTILRLRLKQDDVSGFATYIFTVHERLFREVSLTESRYRVKVEGWGRG